MAGGTLRLEGTAESFTARLAKGSVHLDRLSKLIGNEMVVDGEVELIECRFAGNPQDPRAGTAW